MNLTKKEVFMKNKKLTALEALAKVRDCLYPWASDNQKAFDIIETALKDINEIMSNHNCSNLSELNEKLCDYEELKFDDDIKRNKLKALDIIIDKKLDVGWFFWYSRRFAATFTYNDYLAANPPKTRAYFTEEQFNILKDVILNKEEPEINPKNLFVNTQQSPNTCIKIGDNLKVAFYRSKPFTKRQKRHLYNYFGVKVEESK